MYHKMDKPLDLQLDRLSKISLSEQIHIGITKAIEKGIKRHPVQNRDRKILRFPTL
ncbi:hypothetical protein ID852_12140 [Xenorhabdus sp. 42]|nr:hypothetical protein [Xenorhabdus sp. 42]MBD2821428.1 hypothetical protein [Xenorhabdus sp. 42]